MKYTVEEINEKFKSLPEELQEAITSANTITKLDGISKKYSLMLDQASELGDEVGLFMVGLVKQKDFVKNIAERMGIRLSVAESISRDINTEVFDPIRDSLQKMQEGEGMDDPVYQSRPLPPTNLPTPTPSIPAPSFVGLEKAGQFTIEKTPISNSSQYKEENINKEALLKSIEDKPEPAVPATAPMIDHLLTAHVNTSEKVEVKAVPVVVEEKKIEEKKVVEPKKPYTADPYREQF